MSTNCKEYMVIRKTKQNKKTFIRCVKKKKKTTWKKTRRYLIPQFCPPHADSSVCVSKKKDRDHSPTPRLMSETIRGHALCTSATYHTAQLFSSLHRCYLLSETQQSVPTFPLPMALPHPACSLSTYDHLICPMYFTYLSSYLLSSPSRT